MSAITNRQLVHRRKPWILLLTTPIQADSISKQIMAALNEQLIQNTKSDVSFSDELSTRFQNGEDVAAYLERVSQNTGDGLLSIFSLGISKWLIHLAEQAKFKVIKLKGYSYSMFRKPPYDANMVSLCFLFEPIEITIADGTGLTSNPEPAPNAGEQPISTHLRALRRSFDIENLDVKLQEDSAKQQEMIMQSKELLKKVGYPVDDEADGYDAWLASVAQVTVEDAQPEQQLN